MGVAQRRCHGARNVTSQRNVNILSHISAEEAARILNGIVQHQSRRLLIRHVKALTETKLLKNKSGSIVVAMATGYLGNESILTVRFFL